jgi:beta-1,4-mannosyl-glycoprotein beta-1,4-N-acetylglucosaminyltransferase
MAFYDCTMFLNENDLFEIRLNQHWNFVDKFIVVEAGETHTGLKKNLKFDHQRFEPYKSKIVYITFDNFEEEISKYPFLVDQSALDRVGPAHEKIDWKRDHFQFNYIKKVLGDLGANKNDYVYISCLDEIVKEESVKLGMSIINQMPIVPNIGTSPIILFNMYLYAYKMNLLCHHWKNHMAGMLTTVSTFDKILPASIRQKCIFTHGPIPDAGWHFTFLDKTEGEMVLEKQRSWAHSKDRYPDKKIKFDHRTTEEALERFFEDYSVSLVDIDINTHPEYIVKNIEKFQNFLYKEQE